MYYSYSYSYSYKRTYFFPAVQSRNHLYRTRIMYYSYSYSYSYKPTAIQSQNILYKAGITYAQLQLFRTKITYYSYSYSYRRTCTELELRIAATATTTDVRTFFQLYKAGITYSCTEPESRITTTATATVTATATNLYKARITFVRACLPILAVSRTTFILSFSINANKTVRLVVYVGSIAA
ncbi:hypothetical protein B0O99DRAFT_603422 [Bisporella sp. PMI_857]|nr:hypothetical protein B0O99DRAFT_603422 [Bisporella sp. PMI_857]